MKRLVLASLVALLAAGPVSADVSMDGPWVRATVPSQKTTGAFMRLTSDSTARLVGASSPLAGAVEIHETKMDGDVMKMTQISAISLPAGKSVEFKPGGYHLMLIDLKAQVREGDSVPLTLFIEGEDGKQRAQNVTALVRPLRQAMDGAAAMSHHH